MQQLAICSSSARRASSDSSLQSLGTVIFLSHLLGDGQVLLQSTAAGLPDTERATDTGGGGVGVGRAGEGFPAHPSLGWGQHGQEAAGDLSCGRSRRTEETPLGRKVCSSWRRDHRSTFYLNSDFQSRGFSYFLKKKIQEKFSIFHLRRFSGKKAQCDLRGTSCGGCTGEPGRRAAPDVDG